MRPVTKTSDAPPPARCLPGFEHLQRQWDSHAQRWTVRILPGEYYVTCEDEAITTVLGSCISACVRDPKRGVGGMNHFMLPEESTSGHNAWLDPAVGLATRYGSYAMESLVNDLLKLGADRRHLEVKLFGAGRILGVGTDVGARNISFIRRFVEMEGYAIAAEDLGGTHPRKIIYFPARGNVKMRRLGTQDNRNIADREQNYLASLDRKQDGGDVELFD